MRYLDKQKLNISIVNDKKLSFFTERTTKKQHSIRDTSVILNEK